MLRFDPICALSPNAKCYDLTPFVLFLMGPLEIISAYATIVQLIGQFQQGRNEASQMTDQEFLDWLSENHNDPIRKIIQENRDLQTGIAKLLREDNRTIVSKIDELGSMLTSVASQVGEFRAVLDALAPGAQVEPDVLHLLRELVEKDWKRFGLSGPSSNPDLLIIDGKCEPITLAEGGTQFLGQDLGNLASLGFLDFRQGEHSKNYALTRAAYRYVNARKMTET
jgi:hypothetical protein